MKPVNFEYHCNGSGFKQMLVAGSWMLDADGMIDENYPSSFQ